MLSPQWTIEKQRGMERSLAGKTKEESACTTVTFLSWLSPFQICPSIFIIFGTTLLFFPNLFTHHLTAWITYTLTFQSRLGQRVRRDVKKTLRNPSWVAPLEVLLARKIVPTDDLVVRNSSSYVPLRRGWSPIMVIFLNPWLLGHWRKEGKTHNHNHTEVKERWEWGFLSEKHLL